MQLNNVQLLNNSAIVHTKIFGECKPMQNVVVSVNGVLELGVVKGTIEADEETATFVRFANKEDMLAKCDNCKLARKTLTEVKQIAEKLNLDMKISFVSYSLDKSKLTINYTADERVDFREMLKILTSTFKTKIEMKQIGNRDESKAVGALGVCGRETCCKAYLKDFDKVSIKMAKNQGIALNPNRINGMCGRLLCCLKYEDEFYEKMQKLMPKVGFKVTTPDGVGTVASTDLLKETVTVTFKKDEDTSENKTYALADIKFNLKDKASKEN